MTTRLDIGVVAGETSGDLLGAHALAQLRLSHPRLQVAGIAGPRLTEQGARAIYPSDKLAVNGYVEVLIHLPELLWIRRRVGDAMLAARPRVFMGIDAPDFNFGLEARLKAAGIPTVHFVSPSIWAWRPERIHKIREAVTKMLVVFPFEAAIYEAADIPVEYVGHPLADAIALDVDTAAARRELGVTGAPVIALLPGSRVNEVKRHAELMLAAAARMLAVHPGAQFVLPAANAAGRALIDAAARAHALPLTVTDGQSHTALAACDVALVASGTATLETLLFKKPMVVTYRVPALTARMMRKQALLPWIGLPNILAREWLVPERVQEAATAENLAADALAWLDDAARSTAFAARADEIHHALRQGAATRIAAALTPYLDAA